MSIFSFYTRFFSLYFSIFFLNIFLYISLLHFSTFFFYNIFSVFSLYFYLYFSSLHFSVYFSLTAYPYFLLTKFSIKIHVCTYIFYSPFKSKFWLIYLNLMKYDSKQKCQIFFYNYIEIFLVFIENFCEDRQGTAYGNVFILLKAAGKIFFLYLRKPSV